MSRIEQALEKAAQLRQDEREIEMNEPGKKAEQPSSRPVFFFQKPVFDLQAVHRHIVCITQPSSPTAEEYRKLRARICRRTEKDFFNTIMITSSFDGEGKSITALNLAVALAQDIDHTVLLVDADLRRPSIHTYLGITPKHGLSEYLQSRVQLQDILIQTGIGKLVLLPAGTPPKNPSELIASRKMRDLIVDLKYRYRDRYVLFDSPPLLTAADGIYLKDSIDGALFVIQALRTSEKSAHRALELLKGTHLFGTVYNNVPEYLLTNGVSYYGRIPKAGENDMVHAAMLMKNAEHSFRTLCDSKKVQKIGSKIKSGKDGLMKWTKKS
ncbi:MAG: XrtA-associated tyrosine autokinase [Nitrospirota bacterium]